MKIECYSFLVQHGTVPLRWVHCSYDLEWEQRQSFQSSKYYLFCGPLFRLNLKLRYHFIRRETLYLVQKNGSATSLCKFTNDTLPRRAVQLTSFLAYFHILISSYVNYVCHHPYTWMNTSITLNYDSWFTFFFTNFVHTAKFPESEITIFNTFRTYFSKRYYKISLDTWSFSLHFYVLKLYLVYIIM